MGRRCDDRAEVTERLENAPLLTQKTGGCAQEALRSWKGRKQMLALEFWEDKQSCQPLDFWPSETHFRL